MVMLSIAVCSNCDSRFMPEGTDIQPCYSMSTGGCPVVAKEGLQGGRM